MRFIHVLQGRFSRGRLINLHSLFCVCNAKRIEMKEVFVLIVSFNMATGWFLNKRAVHKRQSDVKGGAVLRIEFKAH